MLSIEVKPKTVEEWLNTVVYSPDPNYVPSLFALEFVTFIKMVNGGKGEENKTPEVHLKMLDNVANGSKDIANLCHRGLGKALSLDAILYTDTGTTTIRDVAPGDKIYGEDGKLTTVLTKSVIFDKPMYRLHLADGRSIKVCEDHINTVIHHRQRRVNGVRQNYLDRRDLTTKELLKVKLSSTRTKTPKNPKGSEARVWIPVAKAVEYSEKQMPLDPYTLGLLLGDGNFAKDSGYTRLTAHINDAGHYKERIPYTLGVDQFDKRNPNVLTFGVLGIGKSIKDLNLNVHGNFKFIPDIFLRGSIPQRLDLLRGLMDSDGTTSVGCASYSTTSEKLKDGVVSLVQSLGLVAKVSIKNTSSNLGKAFNISVRGDINPFSLPRKADKYNCTKVDKVPLVRIEPIAVEPSQCISVDNSTKTFLTDGYTVTHNTAVLAEYLYLYIAVNGGIPGVIDIDLGIYVSDSMENGVKNMRKNLEFRWENSEFLRHYIPKTKFTDNRWEFINIDGESLIIKGYGAKALSLNTMLYTEEGITSIGEVQVGDKIYGANGVLTTVTKKSEVFNKPMYRISLEDGRSLKVSEDHLNPVVLKGNVNNKAEYYDVVLPTLELLEQPLLHSRKRTRKGKSDYISNENLMFVRNIEPIQYPHKDLPIDPYTLGVVLGDGRIRKECGSVELTAHQDEFEHYYENIPYVFGTYRKDPRSNAATQSIRGLGKPLKEMELNVRGELKFIPDVYWTASIEQRLALVQGLMDTDGTVSDTGRTTFCSSSYQLCDDLACMVRSLGGTAKFSKLGKASAYRIEIWMEQCCFKLQRKAIKFKPRTKLVAVTKLKSIKQEPSQCIAVDNEDRQFIAECYFRTHNTGVRGAKEKGRRPQLAILDDLISDEDARSPTMIEKIEDTVYSAIEHALHPTNHLTIWSGTPFNAKDPLYKAVESGAWTVNVYPVCEKFPCTREEFRGSWEDRFTYDYVLDKYNKALKTGKIDSFNQELMLRIMSEEDRLVKDHEIQWYRRDALIQNIGAYNIYITTDFATKEKESNDYSVISVWALNHNGDWFWIDGICAKQDMSKNIKDLFYLVQKYNPISVGIEVSGQQQGFVSWIRNEMMSKNIFFNLESDNNGGMPGIRPNKDKLTRFKLVVPWFRMGKIYLPIELKEESIMMEAVEEITLASNKGFKSKYDDWIDTLTMLYVMKTFKPSAGNTFTKMAEGMWSEDDDEDDQLSSYIV